MVPPNRLNGVRSMLTASTPHAADIFRHVEMVIAAVKRGEMIIMTDSHDRENEGDLVFAAEDVTPEKINFMLVQARGLVCLALAGPMVDQLQLPLMADMGKKHGRLGTAFTVSIEARRGVTTGISAQDRTTTVLAAIAEHAAPEDLTVPGHIFPIRARPGGVLERPGHTEGSVDIARLAGKKSAAVICEIMNSDGSMARLPDLEQFAEHFGIPILKIEDLITYRLAHESLVTEVARREFVGPNQQSWLGVWFENPLDGDVHFALIKGWPGFADTEVQVRVHKHDPLGELLSSDTCSDPLLSMGRRKIEYAQNLLSQHNHAVVLFLANSDKRGLLGALETKAFDSRLYGIGAQILQKLGVQRMALHATSDQPLAAIRAFGLEVARTVVLPT
jgi:3,4-dihydroxy 2-butanone 4-phosphate synthase/GTP cyclohydrolase II